MTLNLCADADLVYTLFPLQLGKFPVLSLSALSSLPQFLVYPSLLYPFRTKILLSFFARGISLMVLTNFVSVHI